MYRRIILGTIWLATLGIAFIVGVQVHKHRDAIRARLRSFQGSPPLQTNLYNLRVRKLVIPAEGRDGAIDAMGNGFLVVSRRGKSWFAKPDGALEELALTIPVNLAEFESDAFNTTTTDHDRFSVKDILVQPTATGHRILASHLYWNRDKRCNTLRVSAIETDSIWLRRSSEPGSWRTVFESAPCRELIRNPDNASHHVTLGAGGRLAAVAPDQVLVTVGEFSADYMVEPGTAQDSADVYGKTMLIDLVKGTAMQFTRGHRNPQGLAVGPDGRIWETEHAARGGDELNLLVQGRHYGAPYVSLGTQYELRVWPYSKTQGRHDGYEKPFYSWVPSIATSQLVVVRGEQFPWWSNDLLVGSLAAQSLFRVHVDEDRVLFVEPIPIGHRVRDMAQMVDGTIAVKTDDDYVLFIDNIDRVSGASIDPVSRGALLGAQCRSCHVMQPGMAPGIGPSLWGVVGRRVASSAGYSYSEALRHVGGTWTVERLRQFVADPTGFAPGNRMQTATRYSDQELTDLIAYLETLKW